MAERVVLVDGSALVFRAYFALPALATSKGLPTNATYGFARALQKVIGPRRPALGAVVLDAPGPTFRAERYPAYKAGRRRMPPELQVQLPWVERLIEAHRFPLVRVPGFEADDVIGTLCRMALEAGHEVLLVSGDKDLAQLVGPRVRLLDTMRERTFDEELVRKRFGVGPELLVDWLALVGDPTDNLPGVKGVGAKGAATLLETYRSLEGIWAHLDELKPKQRASLEAGRADALLTRDLARIRTDVPLSFGLEALAVPPPDPAALDALHRELEFYSLLAAAPADDGAQDFAALEGAEAARAWLAEVGGGELAVVGVFEELEAAHPPLAGLALSPRPGVGRWLALPGELDGAWASLRAWLEDPARPKLSHAWKALYVALRARGVVARGCVFDAGLASYLIDPTKLVPHRLDQVAREYLHRPLAPQKGSPLPAWACQQAEAVAALVPVLRPRIEAEGHAAQLLERDLPLSTVLGEMEHAGIKVDTDELVRLERELVERAAAAERRVHELAGRAFNVASTRQLAQVLFEELGLPVIKRTKTGYSTDEEVLTRLAPRHEIALHLLEQRRLTKLVNTFTEVLRSAADPVTGRIHAVFTQTVSASGRLGTASPDLQRTPIHTPEGRRIRRAFVTDPGWKLCSADWHQLDLRLLAHLSRDEGLIAAFRAGVDVHRRTAAELFGVAPEAVSPEQRKTGKTVNYATIYGQGATALGQSLGIPRKEAQAYIARFFALHEGVREWLDAAVEEARERGYATTILGRRRAIPELTSKDPMVRAAGERVAASTPLHGSVADICKQVMLELPPRFAAGGLTARLVLQVHDELVLEAPAAEVERAAAILRERMEGAVRLDVPLAIGLGIGDSWGEAHG